MDGGKNRMQGREGRGYDGGGIIMCYPKLQLEENFSEYKKEQFSILVNDSYNRSDLRSVYHHSLKT